MRRLEHRVTLWGDSGPGGPWRATARGHPALNFGKDSWGEPSGRLATTSLSTLSLEVYYRYLPICKLAASNPVEKTPVHGRSGAP